MILYGASGHARVIRDIVEAQGDSVGKLIDDNTSVSTLDSLPVIHELTLEEPLIVSIGSNAIRRKVVGKIEAAGTEKRELFGTAVHPTAIVSPSATIGKGTVVMQGAIIQAKAAIGEHCIVNTGASIDHECRIGNYVHVSPHATLCGDVCVGEGSWIGAGATVIQGIKIGRWCVIGAGSVVTKDIPDGYLAVGNRCRLIKKINQDLL